MRIINGISVVFSFVLVLGDSNENPLMNIDENSLEFDSAIGEDDSGVADNQIRELFNRIEQNINRILTRNLDDGYDTDNLDL